VPAIFALTPTGQGAVLISSDGSIAAPVGTFQGSRPVKRGEYIQIYATGLGGVTNQPQTGRTPTGLATTLTTPAVGIACDQFTPDATCQIPPSFSGLAPGLVGLYQINVAVPAYVRTGPAVPLSLWFGTFGTPGQLSSNTVTIAIE
jgi:uncharacterized protein (TIGR03437 family)